MTKHEFLQENDGFETIHPKVYQLLRHAILSDQLHPGERLVERKLAQQMGVSRTPVREAIRKLELEGLVRQVPRRGVVVARMSPKEAWEVYVIRAVLEGLAARLAAQRIQKEGLDSLERLVEQMQKAMEEKDTEQLNALHLEFNEIIYRAAQSPRLHQMISNMVDYIIGFTKMGYSVPGRMHEATEEHRDLVEAIKKGNGEEAERIGRMHIERSCEAYFVQRALTEQRDLTEIPRRRTKKAALPQESSF